MCIQGKAKKLCIGKEVKLMGRKSTKRNREHWAKIVRQYEAGELSESRMDEIAKANGCTIEEAILKMCTFLEERPYMVSDFGIRELRAFIVNATKVNAISSEERKKYESVCKADFDVIVRWAIARVNRYEQKHCLYRSMSRQEMYADEFEFITATRDDED